MMRSVIALALSLCSGAAFADCPSSFADAAQGVYVESEDYMHRYDRRADGSVEEIEVHIEDGELYRYVSQHGIFVLESWAMVGVRLDPQTHEVITYDTPLPPMITANATFASGSTSQYGREAPSSDPISMQAGSPRQMQIGDCSVATLDVQVTTGRGSDAHVDHYVYFPALGFAAYAGGGPVADAPQPSVLHYIGTAPRPIADGAAPSVPPAGTK